MPKPGPRTTTRHSNEFKATAVRLSELPGVRVQGVAASLYIHPFMLSRWRKNGTRSHQRGHHHDQSKRSCTDRLHCLGSSASCTHGNHPDAACPARKDPRQWVRSGPVSYTHLTLPTSDLV